MPLSNKAALRALLPYKEQRAGRVGMAVGRWARAGRVTSDPGQRETRRGGRHGATGDAARRGGRRAPGRAGDGRTTRGGRRARKRGRCRAATHGRQDGRLPSFFCAQRAFGKKPPGIAAKPRFPPGNRAPGASLPSALRGRVDCPAGIRAQNSSRQHFLPASPRGKSQPSEKLAIITRRGLFSRGPKTSDACRQEYALGRCLAKTPEEEHKAIRSPRIKIPLGKVRS